jgi:hypothetical protein
MSTVAGVSVDTNLLKCQLEQTNEAFPVAKRPVIHEWHPPRHKSFAIFWPTEEMNFVEVTIKRFYVPGSGSRERL